MAWFMPIVHVTQHSIVLDLAVQHHHFCCVQCLNTLISKQCTECLHVLTASVLLLRCHCCAAVITVVMLPGSTTSSCPLGGHQPMMACTASLKRDPSSTVCMYSSTFLTLHCPPPLTPQQVPVLAVRGLDGASMGQTGTSVTDTGAVGSMENIGHGQVGTTGSEVCGQTTGTKRPVLS
jgi:hypothetical protein